MRPNIHPEYRKVLFHDLASNTCFLIGSTLQTGRTKQWEDGNTYPVATIDCDQYYAAQDSIKLARFYAAANPSAVLAMIATSDALRAALRR